MAKKRRKLGACNPNKASFLSPFIGDRQELTSNLNMFPALEVHHRFPDGKLVLCDGSVSGIPLSQVEARVCGMPSLQTKNKEPLKRLSKVRRCSPIFVLKATYGSQWYKLFKCKNCKFWIGRCTQGKLNKTASSVACELLERKQL